MAEHSETTHQDLVGDAGPEPTEPGYLAWKRTKIEAALREADARTRKRLTEKEVWNHFGLEY